jgi:deoxyribose-phosphate aldolase
MDQPQLFQYIDHTLLTPTATFEQIIQAAQLAEQYKVACLCIPASYAKAVSSEFPGLNISGTMGFPLGYSTTKAKCYEIEDALNNGCNEIDVVINICELKNQNYQYVLSELQSFRKITHGHLLKVIIETYYLTDEEKIKMCEIITESQADFIKTSTGFAPQGATYSDIELFKLHIGPNVRIKASGGINTLDQIVHFIDLGCDRIGTSKGISLILEEGASL